MKTRKRRVAVTGSWLPLGLEFLRSLACAELSPHGAKLLLDCLAKLGPNATRNGDISLTPKAMAVRGWSSKSSLGAAVQELLDHGLLVRTRQGSRLDCSLFAVTLYPLDCDLGKLDEGPGSYRTIDYMGAGGGLANPPTEAKPASWRRSRKGAATGHRKEAKIKTVTPGRDEIGSERSGAGRTAAENSAEFSSSSRGGTKPAVFAGLIVPPRGTFIESHLSGVSSGVSGRGTA
ncbi:hypothetical protein GPA27_28910 [Aromatoleum toluolicum]|uniref:hypothetical protein n=1 Tax=Aromatoleum toluolicum TaxID=90060 RepID=UPI001B7D1F34|nr:hypothetical protein [Aromatoleum toluolicum]MCQ6963994.1 hypothetical protein [Aromatoleum toluolicum]